MSFGKSQHLMVNIAGCPAELIGNRDLVKKFLDEMPAKINMDLIQPSDPIWVEMSNPDDSGLTGFSVLATSHCSIHTFADRGFALLDIFSCCTFDIKAAIEIIQDTFEPKTLRSWEVDRSDLFNYGI